MTTAIAKETRWQYCTLNHQRIRFVLKRSNRKSIGLRINDEGLMVTAPTWAGKAQINEALEQKANWIIRKTQERNERLAQQAMSQTQWQDGGKLPYLGVPIRLQCNPVLSQVVFSGDLSAPTTTDRLCLHLSPEAESQRIQDLCHSWLQQQAQRDLTQRLQHFLAQCDYGHRFQKLRLASPAKRWGSCSSNGTIMLNWRLIHFRPAMIDYVVAHEVAHLKEMNHSQRFWQEVERLLPTFYTVRQELKQFDPTSLPLF